MDPQLVGRWPANVIFDEARAAELDEQTGTLTSGKWTGAMVTPIKSLT